MPLAPGPIRTSARYLSAWRSADTRLTSEAPGPHVPLILMPGKAFSKGPVIASRLSWPRPPYRFTTPSFLAASRTCAQSPPALAAADAGAAPPTLGLAEAGACPVLGEAACWLPLGAAGAALPHAAKMAAEPARAKDPRSWRRVKRGKAGAGSWVFTAR